MNKLVPEFTIETTNANKHHAIASSTAAGLIAINPTLVCNNLSSDKILAKTGNAVIDIQTPKNKTKFPNGTASVSARVV
jgi:hypothetical protein